MWYDNVLVFERQGRAWRWASISVACAGLRDVGGDIKTALQAISGFPAIWKYWDTNPSH
jgi:hypothetical protein